MSEPPFQMPGHRWDPNKKRFFKILPGQTTGSSSDGESSKAEGVASKRNSSQHKQHQQEEEESMLDKHYAGTPCLPAVRISDAAAARRANVKGAFSQQIVDPIALRQQGRVSIATSEKTQHRRVEAAYSHLELSYAVEIEDWYSRKAQVLAFQTAADNLSLLVFTDDCRISTLNVCRRNVYLDLVSPVWSSGRPLLLQTSQTLIYAPRRCDRHMVSLVCRFQNANDDTQQLLLEMSRPSATLLSFPCKVLYHDMMSWAVHEAPPSASAGAGLGRSQEWLVYLAISTCDNVYVFTLPIAAHKFARSYSHFECRDSDCMAISFCSSGEVLYCGLRSGSVLMWHWKDRSHPPRVLLGKGASVTNLASVSVSELVVVRINGQVQLIDTLSGQVIRELYGHVNSFDFRLGFAVDSKLRLLALGGLDRRVRVWSLDSTLPLGARASDAEAIVRPQDQGQHRDGSQSEGNSGVEKGTTLAAIEFPTQVRVLHWHPRVAMKGRDHFETQAVREEEAETGGEINRWKDLFVGAGAWVYQFRWP